MAVSSRSSVRVFCQLRMERAWRALSSCSVRMACHHEQQMDRSPVEGVKLDPVTRYAQGDLACGYLIRSTVGNRDTVAEAGGLFQLPSHDRFRKCVDVQTLNGVEDGGSLNGFANGVKVVGALQVPDNAAGSEKGTAFH